MRGERPHRPAAVLDRAEPQVPGHLLAGPPGQHRVEDLLLGPQQGHPGHQLQPGSPGSRPASGAHLPSPRRTLPPAPATLMPGGNRGGAGTVTVAPAVPLACSTARATRAILT